jgi:hypothetical protein
MPAIPSGTAGIHQFYLPNHPFFCFLSPGAGSIKRVRLYVAVTGSFQILAGWYLRIEQLAIFFFAGRIQPLFTTRNSVPANFFVYIRPGQ